MRKWLCGWLLAVMAGGALEAAAIRGVVVEHQTGRPLARALLTVQPVAGTAGVSKSVRSNLNGAFEFPPLPAGAYVVTASRRGFAPWQYGQKRWKAAAVPIVLDASGEASITLRLQRFGAIAGTVVDENEVGLPEHEVLAYRNTRPPRLVTRATTDDRGMYRLWGLEPGSYLVRTAAKKGTDDSYLPTFARETARVDDSRPVEVQLDRQSDEVSVRPFPGRLYYVAGQAQVSPPAAVTVALISDMGTQSIVTDASGGFRFDSVSPGSYEIYAQTQGERRAGSGMQAAYSPLAVDREFTEVRLRLGPLADLEIQVEDLQGKPVDSTLFQVLARRKDLSGEGKPETLRPFQGHVRMLPGRWDLTLLTTAGYYVAKFVGPPGTLEAGRADGWNEIVTAGGGLTVKFVLSPSPGLVRGVVSAGGGPVAGAPVYLEAWDPSTRRRLAELRQTRTDLQGRYEFYGLPPGTYRILGTFEFDSPDSGSMDAAGARIVKVEESRDAAVDLELYVLQ